MAIAMIIRFIILILFFVHVRATIMHTHIFGMQNYYFFLTYTNFPTFFFKSLTPFTHLAHRSPIAQLSLASRVPSFCSPVHRGAVAKRLRGSSIHSTPQLRLLGVGLNYETKLLMARGCIYASEVDSIDVPFQVYLRRGRID